MTSSSCFAVGDLTVHVTCGDARLALTNDELARPFLVADLHARNLVRDREGTLRLIDLVAAPWPENVTAREPLIAEWLARVRENPSAGALPGARDDEL